MSGHGLQRADVRPRSSATSTVPAVGAVAIFLGDGPATLGTGFTGDRHVIGRNPPAAAPEADIDTADGSKPWQAGGLAAPGARSPDSFPSGFYSAASAFWLIALSASSAPGCSSRLFSQLWPAARGIID